MQILVKAAGVPIDHYSYESTALLRDIQAKWKTMRLIRESPAFAAVQDKAVMSASRTPDATIYAMDVSFAELADKGEKPYLNELPTSFSLPPDAVDRLRATAGQMASPDFQRLIEDIGGKLEVDLPPASRQPWREIVASTRVFTLSQRLNQRYWSATATVWKFPPMRVVNPRDHASLVDHCAARGTDNVIP
jgi:hypothetical protein